MDITLKSVYFSYTDSVILKDISLHIPTGKICVLLGPNGCGKTTILRIMSGILCPQNGAIYLDCVTLSSLSPQKIAQTISAVEQGVSPNYDFSVEDLVTFGRIPYQVWWKQEQDQDIVQQAMQQTNVLSLAKRSFFTLSMGERQRVWLAMALTQNPQILLLDEPTAHLDIRYQIEIFQLIQKLTRQHLLTVVVSLHDLPLTARFADQVVLIQGGRIIATGDPKHVLIPSHIAFVFGVSSRIIIENDRICGIILE